MTRMPAAASRADCRASLSDLQVTQSCLTLCDPMDCSLPGSSIHGIFQTRVLEWGAISFSRGNNLEGTKGTKEYKNKQLLSGKRSNNNKDTILVVKIPALFP